MYGTIWSLLPFLVVIPLAMLTRQVVPALVVGLLVGSYMMAPTPLGGIDKALYYLYKEVEVSGNLHLILFLYTFGSFVGLVRITGGVNGFAKWLEPRVKSVRGAFAVAWLTSLGTFMAPDFRIIAVAPIMKSIIERLHIRPQKMAYVIDVTATPLISLIPIGTAFVGYMIGLLAVALKHVGSSQAAYPLFLSTIPLNFFAIAILLIGAYISFFSKDVKAANAGERSFAKRQVSSEHKARTVIAHASHLHRGIQMETGKLGTLHKPSEHAAPPEAIDVLSEQAPPSALNLVLPILLLLMLTFFLTWWSGHALATNFFGVLMKADATKAMLQAILITLVVSSLFYLFRGQKISKLMYGVLAGGNEMMAVIVLLVFVWAVSGVSTDLGFSPYVAHTVGAVVPRMLIAPALFVLGSVISYFIGSSFGTWGILMPLGFSLAMTTHASLALIAAAVFASGTLGGFASPLSDNTVAMATVMKLPVVDFANSLLKSTLLAGAVATVFYGIAGFVM
ncbi:Na+/H+ antiporter NhaC family protein [Sulfoacidibacillus thermotolerans]|uniref:Sodium:proton antiporter n=1 Tax=Sulfoacidibacillus thermotolerans TaxID=1765684 RepID=A0A2U3DB76_SULT2|nr:Na+/H+ antiporter NhaC family protein [Sulfoacidibacillus thermotolerans]PWI58538.1 sodium:proton antiporter [Sulfoacidibacillus thermotolerans]